MLLNCDVGKDSWESLGLQGDPTSQSWRKSVLNIHWKDWCWSWNANTLATWCEELTPWKRPWCWERLKAGGEGDNRGWDGWMALPTQWAWVWASSGSWIWTGKPGVLQSVGLQRARNNWVTKLTDYNLLTKAINLIIPFFPLWSSASARKTHFFKVFKELTYLKCCMLKSSLSFRNSLSFLIHSHKSITDNTKLLQSLKDLTIWFSSFLSFF